MSIKYLDEDGEVIESVTGRSQAADLGTPFSTIH